MWMPIAAPMLAVSVVLTAGAASVAVAASKPGGKPPTYNVEPSCRGAVVQQVPGANVEICMRKEMDARDQLAKQWGEFTVADRSYCVPLSSVGGRPTYTELLTCLELARAVRLLRAEQKAGTTGGTAGSGTRR